MSSSMSSRSRRVARDGTFQTKLVKAKLHYRSSHIRSIEACRIKSYQSGGEGEAGVKLAATFSVDRTVSRASQVIAQQRGG